MRTLVLLLLTVTTCSSSFAEQPEGNWYARAFYLLHEDHHTIDTAEVGRDADPVETARLINLSRPEMIQIHAKGNPGWTTYPSRIGHTPPMLRRDVMAVWRGIADQYQYPFSAYFNLGRDGEIMNRHPEWNRSDATGKEIDRALCYHSGVAEEYLWPMIREIMAKYHPDGWWFDGSCFTVRLCYCDRCRSRFRQQTGIDPPTATNEKGWSAYHEMQRQIYRECIRQTAEVVHQLDPQCLVAINWANSLRMPEKPDPGLAYLTGDIGNRVEGLSAEGHWYDGIGVPFDLMTQLNTLSWQTNEDGVKARLTMCPKPPIQIQQEMAIVVANGGRFNVWDNPTPESGLTPARHEFLAEHVAPWLAARKSLCLGSIRLPDVSVLNGAAAHYAVTDASGPMCFNRRNNRIDGATSLLPRLHLNYEMLGDWRLYEQDVRSPLLIVEHPKRLAKRELDSLTDFVRGGGKVLLSAMGIDHGNRHPLHQVFGISGVVGPTAAERLVVNANGHSHSFEHHLFRSKLTTAETLLEVQDKAGSRHPFLTCNQFGDGEAYYFATPLLTAHGRNAVPMELMRHIFEMVAPSTERRIWTDAPEFVEVVLRQQQSSTVLHLVNMASGERQVVKSGRRQYVRIRSLPSVPPCQVSIRAAQKPAQVTLQPQGISLADWSYEDGRVQANIPEFTVHQMVVLQF
jgi:hypothetical protein